jgi:hypothetical protein
MRFVPFRRFCVSLRHPVLFCCDFYCDFCRHAPADVFARHSLWLWLYFISSIVVIIIIIIVIIIIIIIIIIIVIIVIIIIIVIIKKADAYNLCSRPEMRVRQEDILALS